MEHSFVNTGNQKTRHQSFHSGSRPLNGGICLKIRTFYASLAINTRRHANSWA